MHVNLQQCFPPVDAANPPIHFALCMVLPDIAVKVLSTLLVLLHMLKPLLL